MHSMLDAAIAPMVVPTYIVQYNSVAAIILFIVVFYPFSLGCQVGFSAFLLSYC